MVRWKLTDVRTSVSYTLEVNPHTGGTPSVTREITSNTPIGPVARTSYAEGRSTLGPLEFSGTLLTMQQYVAMQRWALSRGLLELQDDLGRVYRGVLTSWRPTRPRKSLPWYHDYSATFAIVADSPAALASQGTNPTSGTTMRLTAAKVALAATATHSARVPNTRLRAAAALVARGAVLVPGGGGDPGTMPDETNTGVPSSVTLTVLSGANKPYAGDTISGNTLIITTAGATYDGWRIDYFVEVRAKNVTLRNCHVRGAAVSAGTGGPLIWVRPDYAASATIEDVTVIPQTPTYAMNGIMGSNFTARRVQIEATVDGVHIHGTTARSDPNAGNVTIEASWIHDLTSYSNPPDTSHSDGSHNDGIQIVGGHNINILYTRIGGTVKNAALMVAEDRNEIYDLLVDHCWLSGGAVTINIADKTYGAMEGVAMTNNTFGRHTTTYDDVPAKVSAGTKAIAVWTGNVWSDGSTPAPIMRT